MVTLTLAGAAHGAGPDTPSQKALVAEFKSHMDRLGKRNEFSGAVLLARHENVLISEAYGLADRRFDIPNRTDTRFNLASVGKMFTGIAIAQLAERGQLGFQDFLRQHLTSLHPEVARKVTLHHLLTHSSGLPSYWTELFATNFSTFRSHRQMVDLVRHQAPAFEPGTAFAYSNTGFVLLGRVIEVVSDQSYEDFIQKNIFGPAGMTNSGFWAYDGPAKNLATGYTPSADGTWRSNVFLHAAKGNAAGGGYSTLSDLHRFALAFQKDTLLQPKSRQTVLRPPGGLIDGRTRGYGIGDHGQGTSRVQGHGGGAPGISTQVRMYPESGFILIVLANVDGAASGPRSTFEALLGRHF